MKQRTPLKACPICGTTMFAAKSAESAASDDTFECPRCGCVIVSTPDKSDDGDKGEQRR